VKHNFCPTNPKTIDLIKKRAAALFRSTLAAADGAPVKPPAKPPAGAVKAEPVRVFHLWPDRGQESTWCSCPACRAFSPDEQNLIAANDAADALAGIDPGARLSYYESSELGGIKVRENLFAMKVYPEEG
jgi:hypothetical protein